jgi:hypothetical protein
MGGRPRLAAAGAIAAAVLIGAPGASAAVTIGSDFTGLSPNTSNLGDTGSPAAVPAGLVASPIDGVVVRWRAAWSSSAGDARIRVITPLSGPFLFKTASAIETDFSGGTGVFAARIPIRAGDRIAIDDMGTGNPVARTGVTGASYDWWSTVPADGATLPPNGNLASQELFVNADVEADADGDGFGDETQDKCPGVSGASGGCAPAVAPTLTPTKKKCKKKHRSKRRAAAEAKKKCKKRK